ncbi:MAG: HEPN domain-containing protein [Candidatus Bathyarchaeia archaeon]
MREDIEMLLKRAGVFEDDAKYDFRNGNLDVCMFHLEQSAQLMVKAKLLDVKGSFKKTHSLRRLLSELADEWRSTEVKEFLDENKVALRDLERAYISSRYFYEEFFEEEVQRAFEAVEKLRNLLWKE